MKKEKKSATKESDQKRRNKVPTGKKTPRLSGFIIIRLVAQVRLAKREKLGKLKSLTAILKQHKEIVAQRVIRSVPPEKLLAMEKKAAASPKTSGRNAIAKTCIKKTCIKRSSPNA